MAGAIDLEKLIAQAQLPALPQSAIQLLELSQDPNNGPEEFAVPIGADPGLTSQVLKFVNSSYFGFSREISSVKLAITMVGVRTVKNFALWSAVFSLVPNPRCGPFDVKLLWQDSVRRGLFARATGRAGGMKEADDLFVAALLQDMSVPILAKERSADYAKLLERRTAEGRRLSELEQERFGWNHAQASALLARKWKLPEDLVQLLERHADLKAVLADPRSAGERAVVLSALLPSVTESAWSESALFDLVWQKLLPGQGVTEVLATVDAEYGEFAPILKLPTPPKTLAAWHAEALEPAAGA